MLKAICSKKNLKDELYYSYISDIIETSIIQDLKQYTHHVYTTRFQHSINESYYNYKICHFYGLDERAGARSGLLQDLYFNSNKANFFECGICMDVFRENEKVQKLSCGHIFHKECLNQWSLAQKTCPLCGENTIPSH